MEDSSRVQTLVADRRQQDENPVNRIKKRKLRNKAADVVFDQDDFKDYMTGFRKRKQQRREHAQKKDEEAEKKEVKEARVMRANRLKQQLGIPEGGRWASSSDSGDDSDGEPHSKMVYSLGDMTTTVTTGSLKLHSDRSSSESEDEEDNEDGEGLKTKKLSEAALQAIKQKVARMQDGFTHPKKKKPVEKPTKKKKKKKGGKKGKKKGR